MDNLINLATFKKATVLILSVVFFFAVPAFAQKKFSKTYPVVKNVGLIIVNRTGTTTVRGWDRDEVRIQAWLDKPLAKILPKNQSGLISIDVVKSNQGRDEVGDVNFVVDVPYSASVNVETRIGNLNVDNVHGNYVRAYVSSEGDVTLTNIGANGVTAKNVIGDMFYDGLLQTNGTYRFNSTSGNINIRIPLDSDFSLVATAPSTRNISLGSFSNTSMRYVGTGRRVVGKVGNGSASLEVTNQQGSISFIRR